MWWHSPVFNHGVIYIFACVCGRETCDKREKKHSASVFVCACKCLRDSREYKSVTQVPKPRDVRKKHHRVIGPHWDRTDPCQTSTKRNIRPSLCPRAGIVSLADCSLLNIGSTLPAIQHGANTIIDHVLLKQFVTWLLEEMAEWVKCGPIHPDPLWRAPPTIPKSTGCQAAEGIFLCVFASTQLH